MSEEYLTPERMERLMDEEASALEHRLDEERELASLEFPHNCCPACGDEEPDIRRHPEACARRQEMMRRCEEAVEEWNGPQDDEHGVFHRAWLEREPAQEEDIAAVAQRAARMVEVGMFTTEEAREALARMGQAWLELDYNQTGIIGEIPRRRRVQMGVERTQGTLPRPGSAYADLLREMQPAAYWGLGAPSGFTYTESGDLLAQRMLIAPVRPPHHPRRQRAMRALRRMIPRRWVFVRLCLFLFWFAAVLTSLLIDASAADWRWFVVYPIIALLDLHLFFLQAYRREGRRRD